MDYSQRLLRLRRKLKKGFDAFLVTSPVNIRYLTGFTGSSGFLVVGRLASVFVTDFRYAEQAQAEVADCEVRIDQRPLPVFLKAELKGIGIGGSLGFEPLLPYSAYAALKDAGLAPQLMGDPLESMRERKDPQELALIAQAVRHAEEAFLHVKKYIRAGVSERSIALRLERRIKELGSSVLPFDIIVASGANSSRPHAGASGKKLESGDLLTIDWGAEAGGYCSDMTRTFLLAGGRNIAKKKRIYALVKKANRRAIRFLKSGERLKDVDSSARGLIADAGYGEYFGHGLGHGVGMEVHEQPRLSQRARGRASEGMVVTVEPGIYVPGLGGVRIEDMVFVGEKRTEVLTGLPVELEIIGS